MEKFTLETGKKAIDKVKVNASMKMEIFTRVIGKRIAFTVSGHFKRLMEKFMKEFGKMG